MIAGSIFAAIADFSTRLQVVTQAQARAETTERDHYTTLMQDIRELRVELRAVRETLDKMQERR
jgi:hypothetical protein